MKLFQLISMFIEECKEQDDGLVVIIKSLDDDMCEIFILIGK